MAASAVSPIASSGTTTLPPKHQRGRPAFTTGSTWTSDSDYHDPDLDVSLALAIITAYAPSPSSPSSTSSASHPSGYEDQLPFCTHTLVSRQRVSTNHQCSGCGAKHWIGWIFQCDVCRIKGCHECKGHWVERSFGGLDGVVLSEEGGGEDARKRTMEGEDLMNAGGNSLVRFGGCTESGEGHCSRSGQGERDAVYRTLGYDSEDIDPDFELELELVRMLL